MEFTRRNLKQAWIINFSFVKYIFLKYHSI